MISKININTLEETEQFAYNLAKQIRQQLLNKSVIIYLIGDLGAGKTTFTRYFIKYFGYQDKVKSPTYSLVEQYEIPGINIYHLDLYRLSAPDECSFLGLDDMLNSKNAIMLIEWPEKGIDFLPVPDITLKFRNDVDNNSRNVEIISDSFKY